RREADGPDHPERTAAELRSRRDRREEPDRNHGEADRGHLEPDQHGGVRPRRANLRGDRPPRESREARPAERGLRPRPTDAGPRPPDGGHVGRRPVPLGPPPTQRDRPEGGDGGPLRDHRPRRDNPRPRVDRGRLRDPVGGVPAGSLVARPRLRDRAERGAPAFDELGEERPDRGAHERRELDPDGRRDPGPRERRARRRHRIRRGGSGRPPRGVRERGRADGRRMARGPSVGSVDRRGRRDRERRAGDEGQGVHREPRGPAAGDERIDRIRAHPVGDPRAAVEGERPSARRLHREDRAGHNGIIENYASLREKLEARGHTFVSQTDTESLVHLIESYYEGNLEDATRKALHEARGSYAILAIHADEPGKVVGARNESPLVVGVGPDENFLASDVPALLRYTDRVLYVMDKEMVVITPKGVSLTDLEG